MIANSYASVTQKSDGSILAGSALGSPNGSRFQVNDVYRNGAAPGTFVLTRTVRVAKANAADEAVQFPIHRRILFTNSTRSISFLRAWNRYDKNSHVVPRAIASDYRDDYFYYRETRSGLPFIMMQDDASGTAFSIAT